MECGSSVACSDDSFAPLFAATGGAIKLARAAILIMVVSEVARNVGGGGGGATCIPLCTHASKALVYLVRREIFFTIVTPQTLKSLCVSN